MGRILLLRHGQATFGLRDYDRLSPTGLVQARLAGEALAQRRLEPTLVVSGGQQRHVQTATAVAEAAGWQVEVEHDRSWAEFDHMDVIAGHKPTYRNVALMKAELLMTFQPRKAFHDMYATAIARWTSGRYDGDYAQTFPAFTRRVDAAMTRVRERVGADGTAVVVTSSGPMSWVATSLLCGGIETWNRLNRVTVNTGMTWLSSNPHEWRVDTVNGWAHLDGQRDVPGVAPGTDLVTLR